MCIQDRLVSTEEHLDPEFTPVFDGKLLFRRFDRDRPELVKALADFDFSRLSDFDFSERPENNPEDEMDIGDIIDKFTSIFSVQDFLRGLSMNCSNFSLPEDLFYKITETSDNPDIPCDFSYFQKRLGVFQISYDELISKTEDENGGLRLDVLYKAETCNKAHVLVYFLDGNTKLLFQEDGLVDEKKAMKKAMKKYYSKIQEIRDEVIRACLQEYVILFNNIDNNIDCPQITRIPPFQS